jgi:hypothetical protein
VGRCWSLALHVARNLTIPIEPPIPTTTDGQRLIALLSWAIVLLVSVFVLPLAKKLLDRAIVRLRGATSSIASRP